MDRLSLPALLSPLFTVMAVTTYNIYDPGAQHWWRLLDAGMETDSDADFELVTTTVRRAAGRIEVVIPGSGLAPVERTELGDGAGDGMGENLQPWIDALFDSLGDTVDPIGTGLAVAENAAEDAYGKRDGYVGVQASGLEKSGDGSGLGDGDMHEEEDGEEDAPYEDDLGEGYGDGFLTGGVLMGTGDLQLGERTVSSVDAGFVGIATAAADRGIDGGESTASEVSGSSLTNDNDDNNRLEVKNPASISSSSFSRAQSQPQSQPPTTPANPHQRGGYRKGSRPSYPSPTPDWRTYPSLQLTSLPDPTPLTPDSELSDTTDPIPPNHTPRYFIACETICLIGLYRAWLCYFDGPPEWERIARAFNKSMKEERGREMQYRTARELKREWKGLFPRDREIWKSGKRPQVPEMWSGVKEEYEWKYPATRWAGLRPRWLRPEGWGVEDGEEEMREEDGGLEWARKQLGEEGNEFLGVGGCDGES